MMRDLFVFAGQSNMMGASVFPPQREVKLKYSSEYKHKPRRLGKAIGSFSSEVYPVGEFSYSNIDMAYSPDMKNEKGESLLADYGKNTYFCPAMYSLKSEEEKTEYPFSVFSEATAQSGATLAPLLAAEWERAGYACSFAHIAKGGVFISHYFTDEMAEEYARRAKKYNLQSKEKIESSISEERMPGAAEYFFEKCKDFFLDSERCFPNGLTKNKCFFWLQGESDANSSPDEYELKLEILWERLKLIGFTHFFCIRVDFFGNENIEGIMKAEENFTSCRPDAYMLTRAASFFTYAKRDESEWFASLPDDEYELCRDSFFGYKNQHINERGFEVIARHSVKNLVRILIENKEPILETENIRTLLGSPRGNKN